MYVCVCVHVWVLVFCCACGGVKISRVVESTCGVHGAKMCNAVVT